jgi:hypothetical protein
MTNSPSRALTALLLAIPGLAATIPLTPRSGPECETIQGSNGLWITADCIDSLYTSPIIVEESLHETPLPHHRVVGYFGGTNTNFSIYLSPKDHRDGRFFQIVYPLQTHEAAAIDVGFALYCQGFSAFRCQEPARRTQTRLFTPNPSPPNTPAMISFRPHGR